MASHAHHVQEPTTYSTTETLADKQDASIDDDGPFQDVKPPHKSHALPPVIPPSHQHRTLVLCFDGTGDQFDDDNSNVEQFVSLLKKDDRKTGIGTYTGASRTVSPFGSEIRKMFDTMFASNIDAHIMGGYKFLMKNYAEGDKICIFGFSRGAYTARCLASMLYKVGLLPRSNNEQVPFAYTMYLNTGQLGWQQANAFKRAFSIPVSIEFLGVWDTVGSVGLKPGGLTLTSNHSSKFIRVFRHAVSLDERRAKFQPNLWHWPSADELKCGLPECHGSDHITDAVEVWFAGCHCDVGGGSVRNGTRHALARIPLRWMVREIFKAKAGIMFLTDRLYEIGLDPSTIYPVVRERPDPLPVGNNKIREAGSNEKATRPPMYRSWKKLPVDEYEALKTGPAAMSGSEEHEELHDALSPVYDQMSINKGWWLVETMPLTREILPLPLSRQWHGLRWSTRIWLNLGTPRAVKWSAESQNSKLKVHRSVKMRMEAEYADERKQRSGKYRPRLIFEEEPEYVG
ncbi:hypothetical protein MD484_g6460, partial [Candolleomyces efflorescens]